MSEQIKDWSDLEQLAQSENPHERCSAVTNARTRAAPVINLIFGWGINLREAVELRRRVVHEEYKPTVEEAITAVRNFFNAWKDGTEQEDVVNDDDTIKSPKISYAEKAREIERRPPPGSAPGVWGHIVNLASSEKADKREESIIFAFDELRVTVCALYNIYPDEIHDPQDNLSLALNDVCMLCDLRPLIFIEGIALVETDQAIVLWANIIKRKLSPTQDDALYAVGRFAELQKIFNDFVAKRREAKIQAVATFTGMEQIKKNQPDGIGGEA